MNTLLRSMIVGLSSFVLASTAMAAGRGTVTGVAQHPTTASTVQTAPPTTLSPHHTTGQPNKSCETTGSPPGRSATAPGSAFNPSGKAGDVYAGEQSQNSRNTASVSQYDVACARHH